MFPGEPANVRHIGPHRPNRASLELVPTGLAASPGCEYNVITLATRTRIIRIGNSRGIRVPRALLQQARLPEEVELQAHPGRLIVRAVRRPRAGWAEAARRMREHDDDEPLDAPTPTRFDQNDWTW